MSTANIIRAWKDENYRSSLSGAELAALPANPAGLSSASDMSQMASDPMALSIIICPTFFCTGHPCGSLVCTTTTI